MARESYLKQELIKILKYTKFGYTREALKEKFIKEGYKPQGIGAALSSLIRSEFLVEDYEGKIFLHETILEEDKKEINEKTKEIVKDMSPDEIAEIFEYLWDENQRKDIIINQWKDAYNRMFKTASKAKIYRQGKEQD